MIDAVRPDLRGTPLWARVEEHFRSLHEPGFGAPCEPADPAIDASGTTLACTVVVRHDLQSAPRQHVLVVGPDGPQLLSHSAGSVRTPTFAPAGAGLAVIVDESGALPRPALLVDGTVQVLPPLPGVTEHLRWSPDGAELLAIVADPGADAAGAQGSGRTTRGDAPAWLPVVMADAPVGGWRRLWRLRLGDGEWRRASPDGVNCWEAVWAGRDHVVAVASERPEEAAWFAARVVEIDLATATVRTLAESLCGCVGLPAADDGGRFVTWVDATCSDRTVVAGDVTLLDRTLGTTRVLDLGGVDVTWQAFRPSGELVVAGQRGLSTVVATVDPVSGAVDERWQSADLTCGQRYPELAVSAGGIAMVLEGYRHPPELARLDADGPRPVTSLRHAGHDAALADAGHIEAVTWRSTDGTEVDGLLVVPDGEGPHPTITYVHGGPVWAWRGRWSMGYAYTLLFARAGFAAFHPNPRGSTGRGEAFRAAVLGDLGGAEVDDVVSGLDALAERGLADPDRLGVFGGSHGGFMAAWLVAVTDRFRASVPYCPVTDWSFMRWTTNDVAAQDHLLAGAPGRDPLAAAGRVHTPTLIITGSRDLITPPSQGLALHRALAEHGVPTGYVEYPLEGHGVRTFPAQIDFSARVLDWFEHFLDVRGAT
jgi:dipeptidyl aminopeptidase/acylaminoacyl peptidase